MPEFEIELFMDENLARGPFPAISKSCLSKNRQHLAVMTWRGNGR